MSTEIYGVELERHGPLAVVIVSGEIDMSNATNVRERIAGFITPDDEAVILDLSSLSFIDSAGLHTVFELGSVLEERRQRLLLSIAPGSQVERTITIVGIPRTLSVHPDRDAATKAALASSTESRPVGPKGDL